MNPPALLFQYDEAWNPTIFIIAQMDLEAAKLREMVDRMLRNIERPENES